MKRKLFVPIMITLVSLLLIGLLIYSIQRHIAGRSFESVNNAISSLIEIQASALYNGCFSRNQTYYLVIEEKLADANILVQKATDSFPLIDLVEIVEGRPPADSFNVILDGELLRIECPIRNGDDETTVPNMVGVAIIQAQRLLDTVSAKDFRIDLVHGRKTTYGIPISANFTSHSLLDSIIIVLLIGFIAVSIFQHYIGKLTPFWILAVSNLSYISLSRLKESLRAIRGMLPCLLFLLGRISDLEAKNSRISILLHCSMILVK